MADIELNIPQLARVVDGIANRFAYEQRKNENETKGQFAKRMLVEEFIIPSVKHGENVAANQAANETNNTDIDTNIVIT